VDLVIASGPSVVSFLNQDRTLFQSVPIVFTTRPGLLAEPPSTGIISEIDLAGTLSAALEAQPDTKQVFVVSGVAPFDKLYEDIFKEQQAAFTGRVSFHSLSGLSMVDLEQRVRHLPSDAIVYFLSLSDDGSGHTFMPLDAVETIAAAANVPVYSWHESALGHGIVGGHLHSSLNDARETARLAARILRGESPQSIPVTTVHSYTYEFDWRQLQRWRISESSLPAGSVIRFREPTLLQRYRAPGDRRRHRRRRADAAHRRPSDSALLDDGAPKARCGAPRLGTTPSFGRCRTSCSFKIGTALTWIGMLAIQTCCTPPRRPFWERR
jgi:hypothetical protein